MLVFSICFYFFLDALPGLSLAHVTNMRLTRTSLHPDDFEPREIEPRASTKEACATFANMKSFKALKFESEVCTLGEAEKTSATENAQPQDLVHIWMGSVVDSNGKL